MDKRILKETLLAQAASFEADVRRKLDMLANGEDFLKDKENLWEQPDILLAAFQEGNKEQNLHAGLRDSAATSQSILKISAKQAIKNNSVADNFRCSMSDKIAALRGCSLPRDYLAGTRK